MEADASKQKFSVVSDRYRYIRVFTGEEELYDHFPDSNEWVNLAANPEYKAILKEMQNRMDKQLSGSPYASLRKGVR